MGGREGEGRGWGEGVWKLAVGSWWLVVVGWLVGWWLVGGWLVGVVVVVVGGGADGVCDENVDP